MLGQSPLIVVILSFLLAALSLVKSLANNKQSSVSIVREISCRNKEVDDTSFRISLLSADTQDFIIKQYSFLFIHGSFHSGWCWSEHYMNYFAEYGYPCYAISLRGTSATRLPFLSKENKVRIEDHVSDVTAVLNHIKDAHNQSVAVISHSFGGMVTMKLLENPPSRLLTCCSIFLCSVPPSGNGQMIARFVNTNLLLSLKIVYGFVFKGVCTNLNLCKELFFQSNPAKVEVNEIDLKRYMANFQRDSRITVDLLALRKTLPSLKINKDYSATWLDSSASFPCLVVGAKGDKLVDVQGVEETGKYFGVSPIFLEDLYHDVMLGTRWSIVAAVVREFLEKEREKERV